MTHVAPPVNICGRNGEPPFGKHYCAIMFGRSVPFYINTTSTVESGLKTTPCSLLSVNVIECQDGNIVKSKGSRLNL